MGRKKSTRPAVDLSGRTFHRWTVVRFDARRGGRRWWVCRCACGTERPVREDNLRAAVRPSHSCGCHKAETSAANLAAANAARLTRHSLRPVEKTMPTERKRLTFIPDVASLAVCGRDIRPDEGGKWSDASQQVNGVLRRHAMLIEQAARELDAVLSPKEWNLIADVNNGCADLWDYSGSSLPMLAGITANVEDGDMLNKAGEAWGVDAKALVRKLRKLSPLHGEAIADAVRWFWDHPDGVDPTKDPWWLPAFRRQAIAAEE